MQSQKDEFAGDRGIQVGETFSFSSVRKQTRSTIFLEGKNDCIDL